MTAPAEYHAASAAVNAAGAACFSIAAAWLLGMLPGTAATLHVACAAVYAASTVSFWALQASYHVFLHAGRQSERFRNVDRGSTFFLIAGTFTPLVAARQSITPAVAAPLVALWAFAAGGMILLVAWKGVPRALTPLGSLGMLALGVAATLATQVAGGTIPVAGVAALLAGTGLVIAGGCVYAARKPNPLPGRFGFHELHHALVLAGSLVVLALVAILLG
ncbi:MAG: hemolysin III family protein [Candidatus Lokiarchaeota archaeon]|nr:hemolysin III family protein [Candidatus Lokiarchaeota archaeon]